MAVTTTHCFYCGVLTTNGVKGGKHPETMKTRDHLFPRARGGTLCDSNKVMACNKCNQDKGCLSVDEFRVIVAMRRGEFSPEFLSMLKVEAERVHKFYGDADLLRIKQTLAWEAAQGEPDWKSHAK